MADWMAAIAAGVAVAISLIAVGYSRQSAEAAARSADAADEVKRAELERNHEMFQPELIDPAFVVEDHNGPTLWFTFTVNRDYRIMPFKLEGDGRSPLTLHPDAYLKANVHAKVFIEALPIGGAWKPSAQYLEFQVWPDGWFCRCGIDGSVPHWIVRRTVTAPPHPRASAEYA